MIDVTPAQILDEWVERLRSGEDEQDTGYLCIIDPKGTGNRNQRRYCCLGILCEIGVKHGLLTRADQGTNATYTWADGGEESREDLLPIEYSAWLGIEQDPVLVDGLDTDKATTLNDDGGFSFREIAARVVKHRARLAAVNG